MSNLWSETTIIIGSSPSEVRYILKRRRWRKYTKLYSKNIECYKRLMTT